MSTTTFAPLFFMRAPTLNEQMSWFARHRLSLQTQLQVSLGRVLSETLERATTVCPGRSMADCRRASACLLACELSYPEQRGRLFCLSGGTGACGGGCWESRKIPRDALWQSRSTCRPCSNVRPCLLGVLGWCLAWPGKASTSKLGCQVPNSNARHLPYGFDPGRHLRPSRLLRGGSSQTGSLSSCLRRGARGAASDSTLRSPPLHMRPSPQQARCPDAGPAHDGPGAQLEMGLPQPGACG